MPSPSQPAAASRHTEDLPPEQAAVALARAWHRISKLERALGFIIERVRALEEAPGAAEGPRGNGAAAGRASR
jgi:hypothetical protein